MIIRDDSAGRRPRAHDRRPKPVRGEVIRMSRTSAYVQLIGCAIAVGFGALITVLWCLSQVNAVGGEREPPALVHLALGVACVATPAGYAYTLARRLRGGRRIVIGADRVQVLEGRGADTTVRASVPFENIETVRCTRVDFGYRLDFELYDVDDPDTYLTGTDADASYREHGYHFAITESYCESMEWLRAEIRDARKRWRKRNPESDE